MKCVEDPGVTATPEPTRLPPERLAELLVGFNVGVELGQLILVAGAMLLAGILAKSRFALPRPLVVDVASSFLVALGVFGFVSRYA